MPPVRRILVIGIAGAGKTTLAVNLGETLGLPVVHLDAFFWNPGWQSTPWEEFRAQVAELVKREAWVMDGNYGRTFDIRLPAADAVILLDLPRIVCIWRVIVRWLTHIGRTRPDMGPGCPEKIDWEFIKWIWDFPKTRLPRVLARLDELPPTTRVYRLRSQREIDRFIAAVRASRELPSGVASGS